MRKLLFFLIYIISLPMYSSAVTDIRYRSITMADGLKANTVRSLTQDKHGFIWIGTDYGLCRYDGVSVSTYPIQDLRDQYITDVLSFGDYILVGTSTGVYSLCLYSEQFEKLGSKSQDGLSIDTQVTSIKADRDSNLWISTIGQGVFSYSKYDNKLSHFPVKEVGKASNKLYIDNEDQVWLLSTSASTPIMRFDKSRNRFHKVTFKSSLPEYGAMAMIQLNDGSRWLGTWNHGLQRISDSESYMKGTLTGYIVPIPSKYIATHIHALYELAPDCVLVGCDEGLLMFNPQTGSLDAYSPFGHNSHNMATSISFSLAAPHFVYSILQDKEGGVWYSTFYSGVNYISPVGQRFQSFTPLGTNAKLGNVISRFCEDQSGNIWIASDDGGVTCYSPQQDKFVDFPSKQQLKGVNAHAFCIDGQNLWIGTYSQGIFILNTKTYELSHVANFPQSVYALYRDSKSRIWIGTMEGTFLYNRDNRNFIKLHDFSAITIDIDEDHKGNLWFSTQGDGLWRFNSSNKVWKQYKPNGESNAMLDIQINNICVDVTGRIIVATPKGVCVYQPQTDDFIKMNLKEGVYSVSSVIEDQGVLWMSTDKGIISYSKNDGVQVFNRYDGLVSELFQPNAGLMASDGCIYFGSIQGFTRFYPYRIRINRQAPSVFITRLEIFNQTVFTGSKQLPKALQYSEKIDLNYDDEMFSLYFAALSYCSPEKNQYAYKLEGFDKEWNYVGSTPKATYTNIPAGTYTFRVKATNNDGIWSKQEATLEIVVHPPFWWTLPAKILYLLLIGGMIWLYVHMRLLKEEKRHKREMQRFNDRKDMEVKEARLTFFTMIAHEIRTPVSLIIGPLEILMKDVVNSTKTNIPVSYHENLQIINRNAHRLLELVNQLLDFNKIQQLEPQRNFAEYNIQEIMESVAERFKPTLQQKGADFQIDYPSEEFVAIVDKEAITKIISNLMTNATKYTHNMVHLSCKVSEDNRTFNIEVEDNGVGICKVDQQKIFSPFYQAQDNKPGTGIGLSIVEYLVNVHGGHISVESQLGKGSIFRVTIPTTQANVITKPSKPAQESKEEKLSRPVLSDSNAKQIVLITEDDEDMLRFLANNFKTDYTVITARNGREGLQQVTRHQVSLIISDWMMPEMDGAEFCKLLRADYRYSHIPFVMLTAKTDDESKTQGMNCGADTFIEKPFSMEYLRACIKNMIEIRHMLFQKYSESPDTPISSVTTSVVDNELLLKMIQVIEDNLEDPGLNVGFLAEHLNISRSGLFAKIKAITDVTPNELIQIVRLKKAAQLIADKKYRINEVSYMVGFNSPSYFAKCFQKQFGVKPGEYAL